MSPKRREFVFKSLFRKRVQAVLTDPEDTFGNPNYIGAGELAARLGSIKSFEKRGEVVFMDGFEHSTLKWKVGGDAGYGVTRSNTYARSGDYSLKIATGTGNPGFGWIQHYHFMPIKKRLGFECAFMLDSGITDLYFRYALFTKTNNYLAEIRYQPQANVLTCLKSTAGWHTIATGLDLKEGDGLFHLWKFVTNLDTGKYVSLYLDDVKYDLTAYDLKKLTAVYTPYMWFGLTCYDGAAGNHYVYIDDVIFTQNEPT